MSDKYKTPREWAEKSDIVRWEIHRTEVGDNGEAVDVWLYRANHHGFYQNFSGAAAVEARQLYKLAKAMKRVKDAEEELADAKEALDELNGVQP